MKVVSGLMVNNFRETKEIDLDDIQHMKVEADASDLVLTSHPSPTIFIDFKGKVKKSETHIPQLLTHQQDDSLTILIDHSFNTYKSAHIQIKVPENLIPSFNLFSHAGDVRVDDLKAEKLQVHLLTGDLKITDSTIQDTNIQIDTGDVTINHLEGDLNIKSLIGDTRINNRTCTGHLAAKSKDGDVKVLFEEQPQSMDLTFNGEESKINLARMRYEVNEHHMVKGIIGNGKYRVNVKTLNGDFKISSN